MLDPFDSQKNKGNRNKYICQKVSWQSLRKGKNFALPQSRRASKSTFKGYLCAVPCARVWQSSCHFAPPAPALTHLPAAHSLWLIIEQIQDDTWSIYRHMYVCVHQWRRRKPHKTFNKWEDRRGPDTQMNSFMRYPEPFQSVSGPPDQAQAAASA